MLKDENHIDKSHSQAKKIENYPKHFGKMRDYYRINDPPLGVGAYGEVRQCVYKENILDKKSSLKQLRAVKIMSKAYMEEREMISFKNEIDCLKTMNHPHIVKLHHYFEDPKRYLIVTDLVSGGELFDMIRTEKKIDHLKAAGIIKQILSAVKYMHKHLYVHRDLKMENILLQDKESELPSIKLIDFGTTR
jgi:calcium-dependent protein kinase